MTTGSDERRSGSRRRVRAVGTRLGLRVILGAALVLRHWWYQEAGRVAAAEVLSGEGASNGRVLLEYAVKELGADAEPDPCEVGLAVTATADVLDALGKASAGLGVAPPQVRHLRRWADALLERASRPPGGRSG